MSSGKQTPRQKLIGMMYLVMLALLALNVSHEVINAFVVVDENLVQSNENFKGKLTDIYENFEQNYVMNPQKVGPFWARARMARFLSAEMVAFIQKTRDELVSRTEGITVDSARNISTRQIDNKDENSISTNYFLGNSDDGSEGVARVLKNKIIAYRQQMLNLVDSSNRKFVNLGLQTDGPYYDADGKQLNWESYFFLNTIVAADIPIMSKLILDVYNAELEVVNNLYKSVGQGDFKFEKIEAKVIPQSNFVFLGDQYEAEVIVAAYDTSHSPEAYYVSDVDSIDTTQLTKANLLQKDSGRLMIRIPVQREGLNTYTGLIRTTTNAGEVRDFRFNSAFIAARPSASISAVKMNVLYAGVDNPISFAVAGVPAENITPVISSGTIRKDPKSQDWIVNVPDNFSSAVISMFTTVNGVRKGMGSQVFRVKKIPNPIASVGGKSSGAINKQILIAAGAVIPKLPEDFDFDYPFTVKSFTLSIQRGFKTLHFNSNNAYLTPEMIEEIRKTNRGQGIVFENVEVLDPLKASRILAPIVLAID